MTQTNSQDEQVLCCQSHGPKRLVRQIAAQVENRILDLRVTLSEQYHRRVGARTIAAYVRREASEQSGTHAM